LKDIGRSNDQYKAWHSAVKKRDKGRCQFPCCKKAGKQVHHIIPYSKAPHLRYSVENGCYLCLKHHKFVTGKENNYVGMFMAIVAKNTK
jgi:hypothetical protein